MILDGDEVVAEIVRYLSTFDEYAGRVTNDLYGNTVPELLKESVQKEVIVVEHVDTDLESSAHGYPINQLNEIEITILRAVKPSNVFSDYRRSTAAIARDIIQRIKDPVAGTLGMPDVDIEFNKNTPGEVMVGSVKCTGIILSGKFKTYFENPNIVDVSGYVKDSSGVGISGVTITFSNGGGTVVTNSLGYYKHSVAMEYSGSATPTLSGWTFSPVSRTYSGIIAYQKKQNYTATENP